MEKRSEEKEEALPLTNEDIRRLVQEYCREDICRLVQEYCREEQCIREAKEVIRRDVILQYHVPSN